MGNIFYREKSLINYISTAAATGSLPADDQKYRYATSQQIGGVIYGLPYGSVYTENNKIIKFEPTNSNKITYISTTAADNQLYRYETSQQIGGVIYGLPYGTITPENNKIIKFEPNNNNKITYIDTTPTTVLASGLLPADNQPYRYRTSQQIGRVIYGLPYGLPYGNLTTQNNRIIKFEPNNNNKITYRHHANDRDSEWVVASRQPGISIRNIATNRRRYIRPALRNLTERK